MELRNAYIDWTVPNTDLKFRMGIQGLSMPNVAGGSAVLFDDAAEEAGALVARLMQDVCPAGKELSVPLLVDWGTGHDWGAAH